MTSPGPTERQQKALELHLAGATYDAIAQALDYASRSGAHEAVQMALKAQHEDPQLEDSVRDELARLDAMLTGLWAKARRGDVAAVDRVLKIGERRTQLVQLQQATAGPQEGSVVDDIAARRARRLAR